MSINNLYLSEYIPFLLSRRFGITTATVTTDNNNTLSITTDTELTAYMLSKVVAACKTAMHMVPANTTLSFVNNESLGCVTTINNSVYNRPFQF